MGPLLDATVRLFGRMDKSGDGEIDRRRFPPMPGAHVICANKDASQRGPAYIWSAIAVAIAEDRNTAANLFIEDANVITADPSSFLPAPEQVTASLESTVKAIAKSMILCGQDQNVVFTKIFAGAKWICAGSDEWGCALTCAPYVVLARDAVAKWPQPSALLELTISQWESHLGLTPLPAPPVEPDTGSYGC